MNKKVIDALKTYLETRGEAVDQKETHISWLLLTPGSVYKVKKPVKFSFLDFSTLEKRGFYCQREVELNRRLAPSMYLGVESVIATPQGYRFEEGNPPGAGEEVVDHAVKMKRMDLSLHMPHLLKKDQVRSDHVEKLADQVARFHKKAPVIREPMDIGSQRKRFNDILKEKAMLEEQVGRDAGIVWEKAVAVSDAFLQKNEALIKDRTARGMVRDGHGDLHSGNIFLYNEPVIFDCIEFNDEFRAIDVLNDIAFLCMDLEANGKAGLSKAFVRRYNRRFPCMEGNDDETLFLYYKLFRANIRAKVGTLRLVECEDKKVWEKEWWRVRSYLDLMEAYLDGIKG